MTVKPSGMGIKNKGLLIVGIVLFIIGLVAALYRETVYGITIGQPYLGIGIILVLAGIIFIALGFLYPSQRTAPLQKTPPPP